MSVNFCFPNDIFRLERHESFAIERFAYNAARIGVQALQCGGLPDCLRIVFDNAPNFSAYIGPTKDNSGNTIGFALHSTPISCIIILGICHFFGDVFGDAIFDVDTLGGDHSAFIDSVEAFRSIFSDADQDYEARGLKQFIRNKIAVLGGTDVLAGNCANYFDVLTQFIVNHEIAHAYTNQFSAGIDLSVDVDRRALEIVADTVATEWIYNRLIRNTPDSDAYRALRGTKTHRDSIIQNTHSVVHSQIMTLFLFGIVPSLRAGGKFQLDGGRRHPHGFLRYSLQQIVLTTLVLSNQQQSVNESDFGSIDTYWKNCLGLFIKSGLVEADDIGGVVTRLPDSVEILRAAEFIEGYAPKSLFGIASLLRICANPSTSNDIVSSHD